MTRSCKGYPQNFVLNVLEFLLLYSQPRNLFLLYSRRQRTTCPDTCTRNVNSGSLVSLISNGCLLYVTRLCSISLWFYNRWGPLSVCERSVSVNKNPSWPPCRNWSEPQPISTCQDILSTRQYKLCRRLCCTHHTYACLSQCQASLPPILPITTDLRAKPKRVRILDGNDEGKYSWFAVNMLFNTVHNLTHIHAFILFVLEKTHHKH